MKTKASLVVMSHLSDAQELIIRRQMIEGNQHINFVKFLIFHLGGNLTNEIDADDWWNKFLKSATNIPDKCKELYEKSGMVAVFEYAEELISNGNNVTYSPCKPCETSTPHLFGECLVCGQ
jgi:hypothetical protein